MDMELVDVKINDVIVKPRIREDLGDMTALTESIKQYGLICPIVVNRQKVLIAGMRRVEACKKLGHQEIKAVMVDVPEGMAALSIETQENLCRKTLTEMELYKEIEMKKQFIPAPGRKKDTVVTKIWSRLTALGRSLSKEG